MITREQVADLRVGDVVELRHPDFPLVVTRGPLHMSAGYLALGLFMVRYPSGKPGDGAGDFDLTVVERAPRLYVNHDRAKPVPGDVVRFECQDHPGDSYTNVYLPRDGHDLQPWLSLAHDPGYRYSDDNARCDHLAGWTTRLLVDGETGQVVP